MSRPELLAPPEVFYSQDEANKYVQNTRIQKIQSAMSARAIELLNFPPNSGPMLLLDIGCGSGLSGSVLEEQGHYWIGVDISSNMLQVALEREVEGDLLELDMGTGLPFRPGSFDGAISISALQWLCNADKKEHIPQRRLKTFFTTLFASLRRGSRAVFQFYPQNQIQLEMIVRQSEKCGFTGGLVIDYPNSTRAKKYFLVLSAGPSSTFALPKAKTGNGDDEAMNTDSEEEENEEKEETQQQALFTIGKRPVKMSERQKKGKGGHAPRVPLNSKEWIQWKKEQRKSKNKKVAHDSKYTGRRRKGAF
eukprot:NODE_5198_length_1051_cov_46.525862_g4639_i0.p1 GENE.NODE_5198_length_1051_cov_46.525862_g4639_i0~~NODE_5198_length_1051_cov_46.525862_g4639_i0.p1  ORF type:complete len:307 (+),score=77.10 NODE_5198_length_1051_cov_46.525862_g4639_i0:57-977(+)